MAWPERDEWLLWALGPPVSLSEPKARREPLWSERVLHRRGTDRHKPFPLSRRLGWPPYWLSIQRDRLLPSFVLCRVLPPSGRGAVPQ
jgi:hypothetical protein